MREFFPLWRLLCEELQRVKSAQKLLFLSRFFRLWLASLSKKRKIIHKQILLKSASQVLKNWNSFAALSSRSSMKASIFHASKSKMKAFHFWKISFRNRKNMLDRSTLIINKKKRKYISWFWNKWKSFRDYQARRELIAAQFRKLKRKALFSVWKNKLSIWRVNERNSLNRYSLTIKRKFLGALLETFRFHKEIYGTKQLEKGASYFADTNEARPQKSFNNTDDTLKIFQTKRLRFWWRLWKTQMWFIKALNRANSDYNLNSRKKSFKIWRCQGMRKNSLIYRKFLIKKRCISTWINRYCIVRSIKSKLIHLKFKLEMFKTFQKKMLFSSNCIFNLLIEWKILKFVHERLQGYILIRNGIDLRKAFVIWREQFLKRHYDSSCEKSAIILRRDLLIRKTWMKWKKVLRMKEFDESCQIYKIRRCKAYFSKWRLNFQNVKFQRQRQKVYFENKKLDDDSNLVF